jgi:hypothetical protein
MSRLSIFNFDHEFALAKNGINYLPKKNTAALIENLSSLPAWLSQKNFILNGSVNDEWKNIAEKLNLRCVYVDEIPYSDVNSLKVWGWNKSICRALAAKKISQKFLPNSNELENIRELTSRLTSVEAFAVLKNKLNGWNLPKIPIILTKNSEIGQYTNDATVIKTPFGCSGKGVYIKQKIDKEVCAGIIKEQKFVIIEEFLEEVQNFALEFRIKSEHEIEFVGYSLFKNKNGVQYQGNILMSDKNIEAFLSEYINLSLLEKAKQELTDFIGTKISKVWFWLDYIGVDMMIYKKNNEFLLNPCVEINFRPTMGLIANEFYKKFVDINSEGIFYLDFYKNSYDLLQEHKQKTTDNPLVIENGKIISGYLSLSPILKNANYRARVEINKV